MKNRNQMVSTENVLFILLNLAA